MNNEFFLPEYQTRNKAEIWNELQDNLAKEDQIEDQISSLQVELVETRQRIEQLWREHGDR